MSFVLQKFSDYGTEVPAVARCLPQVSQLLNATTVTKGTRDAILEVVLDLLRHLLRCLAERQEVRKGVEAGKVQIAEKGFGKAPAYSLPGVPDIQGRCESFLHSARLALFQSGRIVKVALRDKFGEDVPDAGHRFDKLLPWSEKTLGADHSLTQALRLVEPWAAMVVQMRNAVDHPKEGEGGALRVFNFRLGTDANSVEDPSWCLTGHVPRPIVEEMEVIEDGLLNVYEELFVGVFECIKGMPAFRVAEIPEDQRDPKCPIRLAVTLDPEMLARANADAKAQATRRD